MARKPARLERAGALTPRDRMWAAIRALASCDAGGAVGAFSPVEIAFLANHRREHQIHLDSVSTYLRSLSRAEPPYVEILDAERYATRITPLLRYRLLRDVGVDAPQVNDDGKPTSEGVAANQIWAALKALREFDREELAAASTTPACAVSPDTVRRYLNHLARAGYVTVARRARRTTGKGAGNSSTKTRYRFIRSMNTGPRAPIVSRDKSVVDANNGRVMAEPRNGGKECRDST